MKAKTLKAKVILESEKEELLKLMRPRQVWVAVILREGDPAVFVSNSHEGVVKSVADYCRSRWKDEVAYDDWLTHEAAGPELPEKDVDVIETYFDTVAEESVNFSKRPMTP